MTPAWVVRDIMTPNPAFVSDRVDLGEVLSVMQARNVQHLPVVREERVVGLISERHLRDALPSVHALKDPEQRRRSLRATRVQQVMIHRPTTIEADAPVLQAITKMRAIRGGSLPVVEGKKLVGIITSGDLISLLEKLLR